MFKHLSKTIIVAAFFACCVPATSSAQGTRNWESVVNNVFKHIHDLDTFAFALPLYQNTNDFMNSQGDYKALLNSEYVLVYTPAKASINDVWYLIDIDRITGEASVAGRGGEIEYLKSDLYDAPGFNEHDKRECTETDKVPHFPQRRVQSCKEIDCAMTLYLNGRGDSEDFVFLQGKELEWQLLVNKKEVNEMCQFDGGNFMILLNIGVPPE